MKNIELEKLINKKLNSNNINDCVPNGLQVEGKELVHKIITGVTANQILLDKAVNQEADSIIVHHGYFWNRESAIINGIKRNRLKILLKNNINLYSWHLPLDIHPVLGNNVQLSKLLNITIKGKISSLVLWGDLITPMSGLDLSLLIKKKLNRSPLWYGKTGNNIIKRVAWCTGKGQEFINTAANFGVDAYITGEVSEQTIHAAHEYRLHFYSAGHHATERGGIIALSNWINKNSDLDVIFIDVINPV